MGRSQRIVDRFPSFFQSEDVENNFYRFIDVFGQMLDQVELDLQKVMRSHWVDTADNEGSQGFDALKKGDLDKIFSLYLENLGGTSLLRQFGRVDRINPKYVAYIDQLIALSKFGFSTRQRLKNKIGAVVAPAGDFTGRLQDLENRLHADTYDRLSIYGLFKEEQKADRSYQNQLTAMIKIVQAEGTDPFSQDAVLALVDQNLPAEKFPRLENRRQYLKSRFLTEPEYTREEALQVFQTEIDLGNAYQKSLTTALNQLYRRADYTPQNARPDDDATFFYPAEEVAAMLQKPLKDYPVPEALRQNLQAKLTAKEYQRENLLNILEAEIDPDKIYRDRIKGLINVLKQGASTREGIVSIVAANLGIVGDSQEAIAAREMIRLEEYLPERIVFAERDTAILEKFVINNPNVIPTEAEIGIRFNNIFLPEVNRDDWLNYRIVNLRVVNETTGQSVQHLGAISTGQQLVFFTNGTAEVNGVSANMTGAPPILPPGDSTWKIEAELELDAARAETTRPDRSRFDLALFDRGRTDRFEHFDTDKTPLVNSMIRFSLFAVKNTPGAFTVVVPWHIPGFTDKFAGLADHPRNKILYIINKVKAAGVYAGLAYELNFVEDQELAERPEWNLEVNRKEEHDIAVSYEVSSRQEPYPGGKEHGLEDRIHLTGILDYTTFDSLNVFG